VTVVINVLPMGIVVSRVGGGSSKASNILFKVDGDPSNDNLIEVAERLVDVLSEIGESGDAALLATEAYAGTPHPHSLMMASAIGASVASARFQFVEIGYLSYTGDEVPTKDALQRAEELHRRYLELV
jgi:hypothetical protein